MSFWINFSLFKNDSVVSVLFGMTQRIHVDERYSENLTTSLVLYFYAFFTMLWKLNPSGFLQFWLLFALIIDNFYQLNQ